MCQFASDSHGLLIVCLVGHLKLNIRERSVTAEAMGGTDGEKTRLKDEVNRDPIELLCMETHHRLRGWKSWMYLSKQPNSFGMRDS